MFNNSKIFFGITLLILLNLHFSSAQENSKMQELFLLDKNDFNPYAEFMTTDIKDVFNPEQSNSYPSGNLFDGYLKTCWVAGSAKTNTSSALYIKVPAAISPDKMILNIFSGYGKNPPLFYKNARPKKIKISLFAAFYPEGFSTETVSLYLIRKYPVEQYIELADSFGVQSFPLHLDKKALLDFRKESLKECGSYTGKSFKRFLKAGAPHSFTPAIIIKVEIQDTYKGTKYDDICISEIYFNDRFVTPYPDKFNEVTNVYIKNDSILIVDYKDKKGVILYKDASSSLFLLSDDWALNWVLLSYVPNEAVGAGSRVEEQYLLVDLKNRHIVNNEFKKQTGKDILSGAIEKDENGTIIYDDFDTKTELK